jgi:hypothetical protein
MTEYKVVKAYRTKQYPNGHINGLGIEFHFASDTKVLDISSVVVIAKIKQGRSFYVEGGGAKAYLEIAISDHTGLEYLRTVRDKTPLDNLTALPTEVWIPYEWDTPTKTVAIPYGMNWYQLARTWNTVSPPVLDSKGCLVKCANENLMPIGFSNYYDGDYIIGSIAHNVLVRGWIKAIFDDIGDGAIMSATITLKLHQTVNQIESTASNQGSALYSVWQLLGPWKDFVDPVSMPATLMINGVPTWGGEIYKEPSWKKKKAASYDPVHQVVTLDVTETMEHWRSGTSTNYGLILLGPDESEQKNNNSFYSCYEILNINADQAYDW